MWGGSSRGMMSEQLWVDRQAAIGCQGCGAGTLRFTVSASRCDQAVGSAVPTCGSCRPRTTSGPSNATPATPPGGAPNAGTPSLSLPTRSPSANTAADPAAGRRPSTRPPTGSASVERSVARPCHSIRQDRHRLPDRIAHRGHLHLVRSVIQNKRPRPAVGAEEAFRWNKPYTAAWTLSDCNGAAREQGGTGGFRGPCRTSAPRRPASWAEPQVAGGATLLAGAGRPRGPASWNL